MDSASGELIVLHLIFRQSQKTTAQHALAVFASRIDAERAPDAYRAPGFMDVAVKAQHGLVLLDRVANGFAAGAVEHDLAAADDLARRVGGPIQLRTGIERGIDWRYMEIEDEPGEVIGPGE